MSRHVNSQQQEFTLPGSRPWLNCTGGRHPLTCRPAAAPAAPAGSSQPTWLPEASSRPALSARPAAIAVPHFMANPGHQNSPLGDLATERRNPAVGDAGPRAAAAVAAANLSNVRYSQLLPASQPQTAYAPWSQRSQMDIMDNIQLKQAEDATQEDHNHTAACDVAVSSAPYPGATAADAYGGNGPSQQEVSRPPRPAPAQTAARLLQDIARKSFNLDGTPGMGAQIDGIGTKLDALDGGQAALAAAVGRLQADLAAQGLALGGLGKTCADLVQAVQCVAGTTGGIEGHLQELLAKPLMVTGDMATQTSPALMAHGPAGGGAAAAAAALAAQVSPTVLQAFNQHRPSSASRPPPAVLPGATAPLARGLSSAAATAAPPPPTKPSMQPTAIIALAAAPLVRPQRQTKKPAARDTVTAAPVPAVVPGSTRKEQSKRSSAPKGRRQVQPAASPPAATVPAQPASASRKRRLEAEAQPMRPTQPQKAPLRQSPPSKEACRAELLFDSLFDEEAEVAMAASPQAQKPAKLAVPAATAGGSGSGSSDCESDLAAAVQRRLEKHRARFTRRRRGVSQRQQDEEEAGAV